MSITVRPLVTEDRANWIRMRRALWPGSKDDHEREVADWLSGRQTEPLAVLIAEVDRRPAGFAELSIRPCAEGCRTQRVAYLEGWFVEPASRRQGIGTALVAAAESWARSQGCSEFASDTQPDNATSIEAHKACGFRDAGLVRCFVKTLS